jgi:hypothetical protein
MKKVLIGLCFLGFTVVEAQNNVQSWIDYRTSYFWNPDWEYFGDYGLRGLLSDTDWSQVYINPAVKWLQSNDLNYRGGARLIYTLQEPQSDRLEFRPWQGVQYIWPRFKNLTFDHYFRLEERFLWDLQDAEFQFNVRARYRLRAKSGNFKLPLIPTNFFFMSALELFGDVIGEDVEEQYVGRNRIFFALGNHITTKFQVELHYILQRSRKRADDDFESVDHIVRLRLKQNFN